MENPPRIGDAMVVVKQANTVVNSQKYHLFGDPTLRLAMPHMTANIDKLTERMRISSLKVQAWDLVQAQGVLRTKTRKKIQRSRGPVILRSSRVQVS